MNTSIIIETAVPIPANAKGRPAVYPFDKMKVGDSFRLDNTHICKISASKAYWAKKLKRKFTARTEGGGVRVWRTK
jgi:hypothetical protein